MDAAAKIEKVRVAEELPRETLVEARRICFQYCFHLVREAQKFLHQISCGRIADFSAHLAQIRRKKQEGSELRRERFGRGHADFRAGVRRNRAAGFARDHGTDYVANRQRWRAFGFRFPLSGQGVCGFTRLADAHGQSIGIDDGIAIAKFAAVVHFYGKAGQPLNHEFSREACVPTRPASYDADLLKLAELLFGELHFIEKDFAGVLRNAAEERVTHRARLLENLFLHEVLVAALFRHDGIPGDMLRGPLNRASIVIHYTDTVLGQNGDVSVSEKEDFARMFEQSRNVAGDKILLVSQSNDGRRAKSRGNNFLRILRGKKHQRVNAAQLFQRTADGFLERNAALRVFLHEMRHDLCVRFCDKLVAFFLQLFFQFEVVFDDSVVHHHNLSGAVAVRMGVFFGGASMRGPSCVADAVRAFDGRLGNCFFQVAQLSRRAANFQLTSAIHDGNAGGVVAAVFQLAQPFNDHGNDFFRANVSKNSAHGGITLEVFYQRHGSGRHQRKSAIRHPRITSIHDLKAVFLDDGVGEDFFGDALELFLSFVAVPAVQIQNEKLPLADVLYGGVTKAGKGVLDGLSLRIEDRAFWHDPNVCFHEGIIALQKRRCNGAGKGHRSELRREKRRLFDSAQDRQAAAVPKDTGWKPALQNGRSARPVTTAQVRTYH